jgi:hypothetical protein
MSQYIKVIMFYGAFKFNLWIEDKKLNKGVYNGYIIFIQI